jgi:hypothetical protein
MSANGHDTEPLGEIVLDRPRVRVRYTSPTWEAENRSGESSWLAVSVLFLVVSTGLGLLYAALPVI